MLPPGTAGCGQRSSRDLNPSRPFADPRGAGRWARRLDREYEYLTTDLLVRPPRFAIAEEVVEARCAKVAWPAKLMSGRAHVLHRQIHDIYLDPRLTRAQQDPLIERATDYYQSCREYAFVSVPEWISLMDEQYYRGAAPHIRAPRSSSTIST